MLGITFFIYQVEEEHEESWATKNNSKFVREF